MEKNVAAAHKSKIAVVVPTRNRPHELNEMLSSIARQSITPIKIVIVDSGEESSSDIATLPISHVYIKTSIRSAAQQRNIGMDWLWKNLSDCDFLAFVDDDVILPSNYLQDLSAVLCKDELIVGVSGIAGKGTKYRNRNFLLDRLGITGPEGVVTKACVNIPVRPNQGLVTQIDWLIGCSLWRYKDIANLRFESDFIGNSIFEDVIFSYKVRRIREKNLAVNSDLVFEHKLSPQARDGIVRSYRDWVRNRSRFQELNQKKFRRINMTIYNWIIATYYLFTGIFGKPNRILAAYGIMREMTRKI